MADATTLPRYRAQPGDAAALQEDLLHALKGLGVGAISQVLPAAPPPVTPDTANVEVTPEGVPIYPAVPGKPMTAPTVAHSVPGLGTYLYSMGAGLTGLAANTFLKSASYDINGQPITDPSTGQTVVPPTVTIPGAAEAAKLNEGSVQQAQKALPFYQPTTEQQKVSEDIGTGVGQAVTSLSPNSAPGIVKLLMPPAKAAPIMAAVGGVAGAVHSPAGDDEAPQSPFTPINPAPTEQPPPATLASSTTSPYAPINSTSTEQPTQATPAVSPYAPINPAPPVSTRPTWQSIFQGSDTGNTTYLKYGLGLAAAAATAWAAARYGPRGLNSIADFVRGQTRDPVEANAILRDVQSGFAPPGTPAVEMPLPNDAGGMTRRWATYNLNPMATMNEYSKAPEVAAQAGTTSKDLIATNEMLNNPANAARRMEGLFRTGVEDGTGHQFPKIVDYKGARDALTPAQQQMADYGAWYASELDIRNQKIAKARADGVVPTADNDASFRVSFPNMSTENLKYAVDMARRDPQVAAWLDQNKTIQAAIVDSAEQRGMITSAQAKAARETYPNFMPTLKADGTYLHSWDGKLLDTNSGYAQIPAPADQAMIKHFDSTIRSMQENDWRRSVLFNQWNLQEANPDASKVVTKTKVPPEPTNTPSDPLGTSLRDEKTASSAMRRNITVQTTAGPVSFDIHNTPFWRGLGGGPQQFYIGTGIGNAVRRIATSMITGPLTTVLGGPFAAKTALRDMMLIPAQAQKGLWLSPFGRATGMRNPLLDYPGFAISTGQTMMRDATSVMVKHLADSLANRADIDSMALRKLFGHDQVDAWVNWIRARLEQTNYEKRLATGAGQGGGFPMLNLETPVQGAQGRYFDPTSNAVVPVRPDFNLIPTRVPLPNFLRQTVNGAARGAATSFINLRTLVHELYGILADSPRNTLHDLNVDNPAYSPRALANATQTVIGNYSTRGAGKWAQGAASSLPFYNTVLQATGAGMAALRDRPFTTGATALTAMITGALAQQLSALTSGPEHVAHMEAQLSNNEAARNVTIYHGPGTDPTVHTTWPLPNEWQGIWPYINGLVGNMLQSWTATAPGNEDALSRLTHTLAEVFGRHVSTELEKQTGIGVVSAAIPDVVPSVGALTTTALTGQEVKSIPDQVVSNWIGNHPLWSGLTRNDQAHKVPGQEGTDGMLERSNSDVLATLMHSLGGAAGNAYDIAHNYGVRSKVDPDWAWAGAMRDLKQQWQDGTRYGNAVWQKSMPLSTFGALEERTNQMWRPVANAANVGSDIRGEGFSSLKHGVPLLVEGESPVPKDPGMRSLYETMGAYGKRISKDIMPQENLIRTQMQNLKGSPYMPEEKQRIQNELSEQLFQVTVKKYQMLQDLNTSLSKLAGGRHIDVGQKINWNGTVDQFHH